MPCGCAVLQAGRWPQAATAYEAAGELKQALAVHYSGSKDYCAAEQLLDAWSAGALVPAGQLLEWRRAHVKKVVHFCNARGDREGLIRAVQSLQEEGLRRRWPGACFMRAEGLAQQGTGLEEMAVACRTWLLPLNGPVCCC